MHASASAARVVAIAVVLPRSVQRLAVGKVDAELGAAAAGRCLLANSEQLPFGLCSAIRQAAGHAVSGLHSSGAPARKQPCSSRPTPWRPRTPEIHRIVSVDRPARSSIHDVGTPPRRPAPGRCSLIERDDGTANAAGVAVRPRSNRRQTAQRTQICIGAVVVLETGTPPPGGCSRSRPPAIDE